MIITGSEVKQNQDKENMKQARIDLDYLDSSLSYINILSNSKSLEMPSNELENSNRNRTKPYFSRINFQ